MDVKNKLREWGRWSNSFNVGTGFKPIWEAIERHAPIVDDTAELRKSSKPLIHDDEALKIDRAVSALHKANPVLAKIIKKVYVDDNNAHEVARYYLTPLEYPAQASMEWDHADKKKVDVKIARQMLKLAHNFIDNELAHIETLAAIKRHLR